MKELHILVRSLKNIDNEPGDCISGVCKDFVIKITIKFSTVVDKETASIEKNIIYFSKTKCYIDKTFWANVH